MLDLLFRRRPRPGAMRTARRAGAMADDHRHAPPHDEADDDGARLEDDAGRDGRVTPNALEQRLEAERGQHPEAEPDQRRQEPDDPGFRQHGAKDLAPAGPDDAQQRQLLRALAHDDRERVQDRERPHEQRDEGEHQQRRVEEPERLADGARLLVDHGLPGHHLDAARAAPPRWRAAPSALSAPGWVDDVDGRRIGRRCRSRACAVGSVERGERRARQVVRRPELGDTRDGEGPRRPEVAAGSAPARPPRSRTSARSRGPSRRRSVSSAGCPGRAAGGRSADRGRTTTPMVGRPARTRSPCRLFRCTARPR